MEEFRVIDNCLMVKLRKEVDHHGAAHICDVADRMLLEENVANVVFDFEDTDFMDSSGIGIIAGRYKKVRVFGGQVYIVNAKSQVKRILLLSGLQRYVVWMKE